MFDTFVDLQCALVGVSVIADRVGRVATALTVMDDTVYVVVIFWSIHA
jgi:hypothetical protein